jgi:hypothetical protein
LRNSSNLVGTSGHAASGHGRVDGVADWSRPRRNASAARPGGTSWRNMASSSAALPSRRPNSAAYRYRTHMRRLIFTILLALIIWAVLLVLANVIGLL